MKAGDQKVFNHCHKAIGVNVGSLYPSILILTLTNHVHNLSPKTDHVIYHSDMMTDMSPN